MRAVLRKASGFVYFVSMTGVTGTKAIDAADVRRMVERRCAARAACRSASASASPRRTKAAAVASYADAVVVGSAIVRLIESKGTDADLVPAVGAFIRALKDATRQRRRRGGCRRRQRLAAPSPRPRPAGAH